MTEGERAATLAFPRRKGVEGEEETKNTRVIPHRVEIKHVGIAVRRRMP